MSTVAEVLVDTLDRVGVKQIFGLIGDSLNPIADAVRRTKIEWIGVRHEEGAALAAAGQAKLTGQLGVCCGTTGPGSTHLVPGLYEANRDHAPVLALSGEMARKQLGTDYFQATNTDLLFRDVSLYTETVSSPEQAPAVIHQAISAAYAGRGVAHLTLPADVLQATVAAGVSSIATLSPLPEVFPTEEAIADAAKRIDASRRIVIMCGAGCRGAAIGSFNNGAVGTALGQANGIQALDRARQVIALCGDGGFNMLMSEFLTAVHHRLPVKVVVYNNGAFGLIVLEAEALGMAAYRKGIEFPNPDYVALARACGAHGFRAAQPGELRATIEQALKVDGPAIIDCAVVSDEMPNFPHIEVDQAGRYAVAKIKEVLDSVVGR